MDYCIVPIFLEMVFQYLRIRNSHYFHFRLIFGLNVQKDKCGGALIRPVRKGSFAWRNHLRIFFVHIANPVPTSLSFLIDDSVFDDSFFAGPRVKEEEVILVDILIIRHDEQDVRLQQACML